MFKRPFLLAILMLFLLGGLASFAIIRITDEDVADFSELLEMRAPQKDPDSPSHRSVHQRQAVAKDILITEGAYRLVCHLESESSWLVLTSHNEKIEVVEHMDKMHGFMQEALYYILPDGSEATIDESGLFYLRGSAATAENALQWDPQWKPMQEVRYLEAEKATYNYNTKMFQAQEVTVVRFRAPGHQLTNTFTGMEQMTAGKADSVEFHMKGGDMELKAHHLKATLFHVEKEIQ